MHTPRGRLRLALIHAYVLAAVLAVVCVAAPSAAAARCNDRWELHPGSCGQRVKDLQWLLGGHKPNAFTEVKATFKGEPNGAYGARTKLAVTSWKYRIGYPRKGQCGAKTDLVNANVGPQFFAILRGTQKRPACWIALVSGRLKAIAAATPTARALAWRQLLISWLGISESPAGSNRGPCISYACTRAGHVFSIQSSTGAYGAAWCVSTQQEAAEFVGYGHFAQNTAGVYFAIDYYAARGLVFAKPKVGSLVAFITYSSRGYRVPGTGTWGSSSRCKRTATPTSPATTPTVSASTRSLTARGRTRSSVSRGRVMSRFGPKAQAGVVTFAMALLTAAVIWALIATSSTSSIATEGNATASSLCSRAHTTYADAQAFRQAFKDYVSAEVTFRSNQAAAFETVFAHLGPKGQASVVGIAISQLASLSANQSAFDTKISNRVKSIPPPACTP
jgi:hypothetical protein